MMLVHLRIELFYEPYGNFIGTIIIVAVAWEVVVCLEVDRNAVFVTNCLDVTILDCGNGVSGNRQA